MKLSENVRQAINRQINAEMWSANLYLSMAMHFAHAGYNGFAGWLRKQSDEEMEHAMDMADYLMKRDGKVEIGAVAAVPTEFGSPLQVFEQVYEHECKVSEMIEQVVSIAHEAHDMASQDFFWKYVREQVEEEDTARQITDRLRMAGDKFILLVERELAESRN